MKPIPESPEEIVTSQEKIDGAIRHFYACLYQSQEHKISNKSIEEFLGEDINRKVPKLTPEMSRKLDGLLTVEEATSYIKRCRSEASPGSDGYTGAFFKVFWRDLKTFIVNSLNFAYEEGSLSLSQRLGVIILLPKPGKDKSLLTNWRPISLLNQVYKILSGALAERLKPTLPAIINEDQKGFVQGRFMGECIRNTYDIIEYANKRPL